MNSFYPIVASRAKHHCEYCSAPEVIFNFPFEVEHIVPPRLGGSGELENLALACRSCNLFKSDHIRYLDPFGGAIERLYNPRVDQWTAHFEWLLESAELLGMTAVGRATLTCLHINSPAQLSARLQWIRLGLIR